VPKIIRIREEFIMLRVKVIKLSKNVKEASTSLTRKLEEKCNRLIDNKNEEKPRSYEEVIKGYMKKEECNPQRNLNHDHDQSRKEFRSTTPQRRSFTSRFVNFFYGHFFYCTKFGHKLADCRAYERNVQARNAYVALQNIEFYKCHSYGHIAWNCISITVASMKKETNIRYTNIWTRKEQEEN
jgi:hypothetical protein